MNRTLARQLSRVCDIDSESACIALLEQAQALAAQAGTPPELAAFLAGLPALLLRIDGSYEQAERDHVGEAVPMDGGREVVAEQMPVTEVERDGIDVGVLQHQQDSLNSRRLSPFTATPPAVQQPAAAHRSRNRIDCPVD